MKATELKYSKKDFEKAVDNYHEKLQAIYDLNLSDLLTENWIRKLNNLKPLTEEQYLKMQEYYEVR